MRTLMVVKVEVTIQFPPQIRAVVEVAGIDQLVLETAPETFDEHVVESAALAVLADLDVSLLQPLQEIGTRELGTLPVLKMSGRTPVSNAASRADRHSWLSRVLERFQLRTQRLYQSITATR